jgi:hypothetical protein
VVQGQPTTLAGTAKGPPDQARSAPATILLSEESSFWTPWPSASRKFLVESTFLPENWRFAPETGLGLDTGWAGYVIHFLILAERITFAQ